MLFRRPRDEQIIARSHYSGHVANLRAQTLRPLPSTQGAPKHATVPCIGLRLRLPEVVRGVVAWGGDLGASVPQKKTRGVGWKCKNRRETEPA